MPKITYKKDNGITWYILGSLVYSISYLILSLVVVRIAGGVEGGVFTFGLSTLGQHIFLLTYFGVRGIHITDVEYKHSYKDYLIHRYCTVFLSIFVSFIYIIIDCSINGNLKTNILSTRNLVIMALLGLNILEGLFDVFDCEYQRSDLINITGQSILVRSLVYDSSLIITLLVMHNLVLAVTLSLILRCFTGLFFLKELYKLDTVINATSCKANIIRIFKESLPLALSAFFDFYVFALTKYVVNYLYGYRFNGFYSLIFMPASLMFVFANFIIRPNSTILSEQYYNNKKTEYEKTKRNLYLKVIFFCVVVLVLSIFLGKYALSVVNILSSYEYNEFFNNGYILLLLTIVAGSLYAILTIPYYILIIKSKQKEILKVYILMLFLATIVSIVLVKKLSLFGAGIAHIVNMLVLLSLLLYKDTQNEN